MKQTILIILLFLGVFHNPIFANDKDSIDIKIDKALQSSMLWLSEDSSHFKAETFIIYNYLERKFNAPSISNTEKYIENIEANKRKYPKLFPFLRLVQSDLKITKNQLQDISNPMNKLLAAAIWSDQVPLYDNYIEDMKHHLTLGDYYMTHVYFGIQFLKEHRNPICKTDKFKELEKESTRLLKIYVKDHPYPVDITIEALVFLAYTNQGEKLVTEEIINQILDIQLKNGAWYYSKDKKVEEQHTVILAMWLLYEYRYPEASKISWILK